MRYYVSYRLGPVVRYRGLGQESKLLRVVVELPVIDFVLFVIFATVGKGCYAVTVGVVTAVECRAIGAIAMAMVIAISVVIAVVVVEDIVLAAGVMDGGIFAFTVAGFLIGICVQNGFAYK